MDDCSKFWHCENGCATHQQCELGFLFDMQTKECKEASNTDCQSRHCVDPQFCPCVNYNAYEDYLCKHDDIEEFFPDMTDCARFLNCTNGCFSSVLCQENYLYRPDKKWCTFPREVQCGERPCLHPDRCGTQPVPTTTTEPPVTESTTTTSTTPTTSTEDCGHTEFCQDHMSMDIYADPFNCRKYWNCFNNGNGEHVTCKDNWLFDLRYMGCNYPYLVDCQDRPICDDCDQNCEYQSTTVAVEHCKVHQCKQDGFFCEDECSQEYCRCVGGIGYLQRCPERQLWDCEEESCNFACMVNGGECCE